jgi:hydrogenase maturation protease
MPDLCEQLRSILQGRVCLVGVGNVEQGDDGIGVRLADMLHDLRSTICDLRVVVAGCEPERHLEEMRSGEFDNVFFLDAVEFDGEPGAVVLLNSSEMAARFPQVSTHKVSLGLLAKLVEANGRTKVWLLGVQPESLRLGRELSSCVQMTLQVLTEVLLKALDARETRGSSETQTSGLARRTGDSRPSAPRLRPSALPC